MLSVYTLDDAKTWDKIVRSFRDYDVYWLSGYMKPFQIHGDGDPMLFYYEDGDTRGINVVMKRDIAKDLVFRGIIEENRWFDFATPYGYGGWLIEGNQTEKLFQTYFDWLEYNNIVSEFVRFHPMLKNHEACRDFYEVVRLGEVVHMDLSSPEVIWNNLTRENRNRIRKAEKNHVRVYDDLFTDTVEQFREVYNATMDRKKADNYYYFSPAFYQSVFNGLSQNTRIFRAEKDGELIAASMMIYANRHMSFHLSGCRQEYNTLAPNNLIMYRAALWGCENGYKTLLLGGGVGSRTDTLLRYKKTFNKGGLSRFYIGKKIIYPREYDELNRLGKALESPYFPQYRAKACY